MKRRTALPKVLTIIFLILLVARAVSLSAPLVQKIPPAPPPDASSPVVIWDADPSLKETLPRNFRTTGDPLKVTNPKTSLCTGLADLRASGSGEFTADGLKFLLTRTRGPVTVFDLRQETHLFVNGLPISWFATNDWANVGRTHAAIEADEAARVQSLKPGSEITVAGGDIKKSGIVSSAPVNLTIRDAKT